MMSHAPGADKGADRHEEKTPAHVDLEAPRTDSARFPNLGRRRRVHLIDGQLWPFRPHLRAGRGIVPLHGRRRALPGFRLRHRRDQLGPCASPCRRRAGGAGQGALACLQPLSHSAAGAPGRAAHRRFVCRPRAVLQFRRGRRWSARSSSPASTRPAGAHPSATAWSPSATRFTGGRSRPSRPVRRPSTSRASSLLWMPSTRWTSTTWMRPARRWATRPRRCWSSRSRARAAFIRRPTRSCRACVRSPTKRAWC